MVFEIPFVVNARGCCDEFYTRNLFQPEGTTMGDCYKLNSISVLVHQPLTLSERKTVLKIVLSIRGMTSIPKNLVSCIVKSCNIRLTSMTAQSILFKACYQHKPTINTTL